MGRLDSHGFLARDAVALGLGIVVALALAGCQPPVGGPGAAGGDEGSSARPFDSWASGSDAPVSVAGRSFDDHWRRASLMVVGIYEGAGDPFLVEPVGGGDPLFFTDSFFRVREVLSGTLPASAQGSHRLTVRQEGGPRHLNGNAASFKAGEAYLLSLRFIADGSSHNTEGDHAYLVGGKGGAWPEVAPGVFGRDGERITIQQARAYDKAIAGSLSEAGDQEAYLAEVERRWREGSCSEEAYLEVKTQVEAERRGYARVMTAEEQRAYEESWEAQGLGMATTA